MQELRVADVHRLHDMAAVSMNQDTPFRDVIARLALNPALRGVFLVDSKLVYTGMMRPMDLMKWARLRLRGAKGRDMSLKEILHIDEAQKASDLLHFNRRYSVHEEDSLQTALDIMLDYEEDVIPVVDSQGRVVGDLTLAEVLLHTLRLERQSDNASGNR